MTSLARTNIAALSRAHEFVSSSFTLGAADVAAYLAAVGDANDYSPTIPPLAAVALGLQALQEEIELPEGSLHTGQEVECLGPLNLGEPLTMTGRVAQRSERQGYVISVIELEIAASAGIAIRARSTIMAPAAAP